MSDVSPDLPPYVEIAGSDGINTTMRLRRCDDGTWEYYRDCGAWGCPFYRDDKGVLRIGPKFMAHLDGLELRMVTKAKWAIDNDASSPVTDGFCG